ncbi:MAG: ATP-binding protein [Anaerolineae bacterium]|nr:ATP-binding protein [Anaerolineae bacterium]NUQ07078.1 PAS domain S-box protein [Anaerolineae bacterium]
MSQAGSPTNPRAERYLSLRWRLLLPVFAVVLAASVLGVYLVSRGMTVGGGEMRALLLDGNTRAVAERLEQFFVEQIDAAAGFLRTPEGRDAFESGDAARLETSLANYARLAGLDALSLVSGGTVAGEMPGSVFMIRAPLENGVTAFVGVAQERLLQVAQAGAAVDILIDDPTRATRAATRAVFLDAGAASADTAPVTLDGVDYLSASVAGFSGLEVTVFMQANPPIAGDAARQLIAITLAIVAAGVLVAAVLIVRLILDRVDRIRVVAERLAVGEVSEPTGMRPTDEVGRLGYALDRYAARVQEKQEELRNSLRRQRRELEHFTAMIESVPDGVVVYDIDGSVTFINEPARQLIGERYNFFKRATDRDITAAVVETLGGISTHSVTPMGIPQRIEVDGRILSVQSAPLRSVAERPIGMVLVLRDVTAEVRREEARAMLLEQVIAELGPDAADAGRRAAPARNDALAFTQEARRRDVALGKLLIEMRELTQVDQQVIRRAQRPVSLEMLVHAAANEWRATASAANLTLEVSIEQNGLTIVGDERRLRWAIGNLLDNAIKYTPPGGKVALEVKGAEGGYARLRVRDTGAGIAAHELPRVFDRFYRGEPTLPNGRRIEMPGVGLGLPTAREIIEAHGGLITLRSTVGIGTAVYFTLPLQGTPVPAVSPSPSLDDESDAGETVRLR